MLQQYWVEALLHVGALLVALVCIGVAGMVSEHYHPVFIRLCERLVEPCQLLVHVLLARVRILLGVLAVLVDKRCGVDEDQAHCHAVVLEHLGVVFCRHVPPCRNARVVQYGLCVAAVLVVAARGEPVEHQFRVRVYELVVGHPERVLRAAYALEVVHVARSCHAFYAHRLRHAPHQFGNGLLVVVPVAAEVVGNIEVNALLELGPVGRSLAEHRHHGGRQDNH